MKMRNHHEWKEGMRLVDHNGFWCTLLAATWNGFAWVLFDNQQVPQSIRVEDIAGGVENPWHPQP